MSLEQAETALQLLGSAALVQLFVKKFLFADVRPLQLSQYVSFWYMPMLLLGCSVFIGVVIFSVSLHPAPLCIQQSYEKSLFSWSIQIDYEVQRAVAVINCPLWLKTVI